MSCPICAYRKPDGVLCGSPALRGQTLCYFHQRQQSSRQRVAQDRRRADILRLHFPPIKTIIDVQIALYEVMLALTDDRMDPHRASALLFALQRITMHLREQP